MATCKYCGEEIEWRKDENDKSWPANPTTGTRHDCRKKEPVKQEYKNPVTEPNNPAPAQKTIPTIEGQIVGIDHDKRLIRVKDIGGTTHLITWPAIRDEAFKKQKEWWFVRLTGEFIDHEFVPSDVAYWKKPDNWPASKGGFGGGGRPYQPRNEKPIIYQVCYKEACETVRSINNKDSAAILKTDEEFSIWFNKMMDMALERAKKDAKALIEASGVQ
jgi:hypothetical protein